MNIGATSLCLEPDISLHRIGVNPWLTGQQER